MDYWIKGVIGRGRLGKRVLEWISEEHNWLKGNVDENERQDVRCVEAENIKVQHVNDPFRLALQFNFGICVYPHTCKSASKQESESNLAKVTLSCTLNNFLSTAPWHSA